MNKLSCDANSSEKKIRAKNVFRRTKRIYYVIFSQNLEGFITLLLEDRLMSRVQARGVRARLLNRNWCFTLNNPEELLDPEFWGCKQAVWQLEMGEEGTPHYQGYVEFAEAKSLAQMKTMDGLERAHFEIRKGTRAQAIEYCEKESTQLEDTCYWPSKEAVDRSRDAKSRGQGKRTDIMDLTDAVRDGMSNGELCADETLRYAYFKYSAHAERFRLNAVSASRSPDEELDVTLYVGPSGTGKSFRLHQECPPGPDWYWKDQGKWFDGYQGQTGIVLDEFRDSWMPWSMLLKLLDNKPFTVEVKGGTVNVVATRFRLSSNVHPRNWYPNVPEQRNWQTSPLRRRLKRIILMQDQVEGFGFEGLIDEAADWVGPGDEPPLQEDPAGVLWSLRFRKE